MATHKPQRRSEQLHQERALERARQGALERAQRGTWLQEMEAAGVRLWSKMGFVALIMVVGVPCGFTVFLDINSQPWLYMVGGGLLCMICSALLMVGIFASSLALDMTRRAAKDALSELQMRRVLATYESEVPLGALEDAGEVSPEHGAVSLSEDAREGAISAAPQDAIAHAHPRQ